MRKIILITGASSGLGRGMAREFAARGRDLALCARRTERLDELKAELLARHPGIRVSVRALDVLDYEQVFEVFRAFRDEFGRLDMVWLAGMGLALAAGAAWLAMIAAPALGVAMGGTAGWWLARRPSQAAPLVLPRLARRSHRGGTEAGLRALSRWPSAMLRADANPRLHALITGSLLMALPDIPLSRALAVLLLLALALLAWNLATAMLKTLREAADWLGVSPLGSRRRQWAVLRKSAASMLVVVVAMAAVALALGFPGWLVLAVAATWLSACIRVFALERGRGAPARRERA